MNQNEHIEKIIKDLSESINDLQEKYGIPKGITVDRCLSTFSIDEMILNNENSIYDQLDSIYKKGLKNLFNDLKKINLLGNPKLFYDKDNTIKISSDILDTLWFHGKRDSISTIMDSYLKELENYLKYLDFEKYLQYILDIPGLKLEKGEPKLTIEDRGIIITFPFDKKDTNYWETIIKTELKDKKMEIMSSILLLRESGNEIYIPQKYDDYNIPEIFKLCLENFNINSVNQPKYVKVFYEGKFVKITYLSGYEFMNNKINKPFCYFYIKDNKLLDKRIQNKINKILRLQDSLE